MKEVVLSVQEREAGSHGSLKALRKEGKVPAVFYGKDVKAQPILIDSKAFIAAIEQHGANAIVSLNLKGGKKSAIVKFIQKDILTQAPIHVDFQSISMTDKVDVKVPIQIVGVADGVKNFGGVMEFIVREVEVKTLPANIPQKISVDVSALGIGQGVTVAGLPKLEGVEYVQDPSTLIVHVVAVTVEEEKPAEPGAEAAQPEVISKGKKDETAEGAAAAAAPAAGAKK